MKTFSIILTLASLLTGCATFEGRSKLDVIAKLGLPSQSMQMMDGEIYQYETCNFGSMSMPLAGPMGTTWIHSGPRCRKRLFIIKDDKVIKDIRGVR